jgi:type I restriction enzyme S subunit
MAAYKPYPKYKNSGVPWLGEVPEYWEVLTINSQFKERREKVSDMDFIPLSVTKIGIVPQLESAAKTMHGENRKKVCKGDFVINSRSDRKGSSGVAKQDGSISVINIVLEPISINPAFSEFLLKSYHFKEEYYRFGKGIVADLWTTRYSEMKKMYVPIPPKEEQTTIARFLDYKLAKINRFIRKKKQLIKLLNEQKAAIINQAVTKGLDPNARMKDSGVEWLGEIPAHWEVRKLKYVANFQSGEMITSESITETGDYPVFGGGGFRGYTNAFTNDGKHVLIGRQGALCGNIKYAEGKFWASEHAIVTYPKISIETIYLGEILSVANLGSLSQTAAQPGISIGQIKHVMIPTPPLSEQHQIVAHIESETAILTTTISTIEKEIALTEEYKTALIAEAVTGKIDVRGYAVPEVENEEEGYEEMEEEMVMAEEEDAAEYQIEETE